MKKLKIETLKKYTGGGLSNKECALLGGTAFAAAGFQQWGSVFTLVGASIIGGCFDN